MHFHRDLLICADTFSRHIVRPTQDDVFAGSPPIGFTFGLGGLVLFPLRAGASTLLLERATPVELADAVAKHRVTVLFTAPTAYRAMLAGGKASALKGLRRCISAGEHLPPEPGGISWRRPESASSTASAAPRCCTSTSPPPTRRSVRLHRAGGARLPGRDPRRERRSRARRRVRPAGRQGPHRMPVPQRRPPAVDHPQTDGR
ncbi:AMP-binding protein [Kutzneria kofuensis]|uniref:AMP-binding protein n=1 Tax=Kutzneria kofuensis TaxID=103725 RepID=UPI0031ED68C3